MSPWRANLEALAARWPGLAAELAARPEPAPAVETAASGDPVARLPDPSGGPGRLLASRRDPRAEAERAARAALTGGVDTVVLLGLGLGYVAEAALAADPEARVLACDAESAVLAAGLAVRDLRPLLADPRLSLLVGGAPAAVSWAFEALRSKTVGIASTPAAVEAGRDWHAGLVEAVERWRDRERVNELTLRRFGRLWVRNLARNFDRVGRHRGISELAGAFAGSPALVLAAGPSLDAVLPELRDLRERAVLVCVDTALRSLLAAGLEPDFVVVSDPQYWNARHLDRAACPTGIVVTEAAVHPAAFRVPAAAVALCSSLYPLGSFAEERAGSPKGRLGAGGSVATGAWDFARTLGCTPIMLAGLDLAFPGGRTHAAASHFEQAALRSGVRLAPASLEGFRAALGGQPFLAPAAGGGEVLTDRRFALYASWFEARLARHPEARSVRIGGGGLEIRGMGSIPVYEALSLPPRRVAIDAAKAAVVASYATPPDGGPEGAARALGELKDFLAGALALAREGEALALAAREACDAGRPVPDLGRLDAVDAGLLASEAKDVVGFLFPSLRELVAATPSSLGESLGLSARVYRTIAESAAFHLEVLGRA